MPPPGPSRPEIKHQGLGAALASSAPATWNKVIAARAIDAMRMKTSHYC
jgi:hypothetical protein